MSKVLGKKFQDEYKNWIYAAAICGLYPPGFEIRVKQVWIRWALHVYSTILMLISFTNLILFSVLALFTNVYYTTGIFILFFRRSIACVPHASKLIYNTIPAGYKRMNRVFETWNNTINVEFYVKQRQKIFSERLKQFRGIFIFVFFISSGLLQVPTLLLLKGRKAVGANMAVFPHDPNEWYHFYLVAYQFINFSVGNLAALIFNILSFMIMLMATTQLHILQDSLRDIFYDGTSIENGKNLETLVKTKDNIKNVRIKLKRWIKIHQETNIWLGEIKALFSFTSAVKFVFLGIYICLAVFTVPNYIKAGRVIDVLFVLAYTVGNYTLLFFESRLADELYETSSLVFMGAYDTTWCAYPYDIRRALQIIQYCSIQRPFRLKALGIIYDNSATFLQIMQSAYQMLSFLLQMDI